MIVLKDGRLKPELTVLKEAASNGPLGATFPPLERETLQSQILARLEEQFLTGAMMPGQKLTLRTLAASMGTSLMPVRDALQHLQSIGALEAQQNRTLMVPVFTPAQLRDIVHVRFSLEGLAVDRVARSAGREDIEILRAKLTALETARQSGGETAYRRAHWAFHLAIAEASEIGTLVKLIKALWLQIGPNVKIGSIKEANAYHRNIVDAIAAGDPDGARRALETDIFYGIDRSADRLASAPPRGRVRKRQAGVSVGLASGLMSGSVLLDSVVGLGCHLI
jgi:DNA-binding GntR family transcriptional regulator